MFPLFIFICLTFYVYFKKKPKNIAPLPPGPPADPIIGHLRLIPPENQQTLFYKWGKIYGDVLHLHFPGRSVIVLNSIQAATDLLDNRSPNYSDRPSFVILEMMGWNFFGNNKRSQRHRRMLQQYLAPHKCVEYRPIQTRETRVLLRNLLNDGDARDDHIRRFSTATIIRIAFGHQISSEDDPYVKIAEKVGYAISNSGSPGNTPVDFLPFLRYFPSWFPGTHYAVLARKNRPFVDTLHDYPVEQVISQMAEGRAKSSFLQTYLEALDHDGPDGSNTLEDIKVAVGGMYGAGVDTTWATLSMFFLAMTLYPEHQARAQKEIDSVVGPNRLPSFEDRHSLPYVECILQETLRWNSATPLGVPHLSVEDDIYKGMLIPKGSIVIANTRAMTLDDTIYSNPAMFNPARFLPKPEGNAEPHPMAPFGFGRKICPGRHLASASLWIVVVSVLATLDISKALDDNGTEITPDLSFTSGITSHPYPFRSSIKRRSNTSRDLISQRDTPGTP
ncbi:cytochrome P450 [Collybia nuda]|uniref:Cytochrome P450 n=1 Tax=Collybia nuda TaxID=64659 RepID=A0A9P5XUA0_9AGAR|nr:cytochrome P450 [Collybia nuda]